MANKIAIFYHLYQYGDWEKIFEEQIIRLQKSGLYDAADYIHIGVNGSYRMPFDLTKVNVVKRNKRTDLESDTLKDLWDFCQKNPDYKVFYFHAKGVTRDNSFIEEVKLWREYLEFFNVDCWKTCTDYLNEYDCVGTEWQNFSHLGAVTRESPHYAGNFWWANASYINRLNADELYSQEIGRFFDELWIGTGKPKYFNFYTGSNGNMYCNPVFPESYRSLVTSKKNCKIGMITMFKNEAHSIGKMLKSVENHIDYWVIQDNGSTDGTPEIVKEWAERTKIPGYVYNVEEGWVGFGWNRDHVLQKFLNSNHGCDWLLKMDCDETLEIDDDFDWRILSEDKSIVSFNIQSEAPGIVYLRTWLWNAHLPWKFNHDPAHETIYLNDGKNDSEFQRVTLPGQFRLMAGAVHGESYTVPTKYISDALKLEEKLIREGSMRENLYHFWYVAKSYNDCYSSSALPFGKRHQREYAKRCIYYFKEYLNHVHDYENTGKPKHIDEMSYVGMVAIGNAYRFLEEYNNAIQTFKDAEAFAPARNEHLVHQAEIYLLHMKYNHMLEITTRLMDPSRTCPFPNYVFLINTTYYHDKDSYCAELHRIAVEETGKRK
jgi:glycosyltransferase involved in cell wall biosynthesis